MSLIVITGKLDPYGLFVEGSMLEGPNDPMHPPITLALITKNLFVSIALFGPSA